MNVPHLVPQSQLALFAGLGLALVFLVHPGRWRWLDPLLAIASCAVAGWVVLQTEPRLAGFRLGGASLGDRAGIETPADLAVGALGLLLVLEATRRSLGPALPVLAAVALLYAAFGSALPSLLLPHRGYGAGRIVAQTFLQSQGVYGVALRVMFTYVFPFVVFGALLEATGATDLIVTAGRRFFARSPGGPAKVAVVSSGLLGSLSGSAVANTATTGTFTIPLMRSAGLAPHVAAGIEAAASTGGALVPPVMGAGAYMMLELVDPPVTFLQIVRAALLPALLFYISLFLVVHAKADEAQSRRPPSEPAGTGGPLLRYEALLVVTALGSLIALIAAGFTVFRAVSAAMAVTLGLAVLNPRTRIGPRALRDLLVRSSRNGVSLVAAAAAVGIVLGVVTLTGLGTRLPGLLLPLAEENLLGALVALMVSSLVLGMGLPPAVCYLLLATLVGPVLARLGVVPLAAHFFLFTFGLMSMVTPPVALAAYAASSIAGSSFLRTSWAAFRYSLFGFVLPFLFVYRPELLLLGIDGSTAPLGTALAAFGAALVGIWGLVAAVTGRLAGPLGPFPRLVCALAALLAFYPIGPALASGPNLLGATLLALVIVRRHWPGPPIPES